MADDWSKGEAPVQGEKLQPPPAPAVPPTQVNVGDAVVQGTPPAPAEKPEEASEKEEFIGLPVRVAGDKVFILREGKKQWITSPEALEKLGFTFGDVSQIDYTTLSIIPEGEPIR